MQNNLDFYMTTMMVMNEFFQYKHSTHEHKVLVQLAYSICKDYIYSCTCFQCGL